MLSYKSDIRERVLLACGTTGISFEKVRSLNISGYDSIDEIIFETALQLDDRYIKVFGLLYECFKIDEVQIRLKEKGQDLQKNSMIRYVSNSKKRIIELVTKNNNVTDRIKNILKDEYEKKK